MKILYALPATGNGHISRAIELYTYLQKYGRVDFLVSGCNSHLSLPLDIKYKSKGISLFYNANGAIDYYKFLQNIHISKLFTEMRNLPVNNYDCVISDFEPLSAWACKIQKKFCLQWGHQASFHYEETPRPRRISTTSEFILQKYAPGDKHIGLHFEAYHKNIFTPVIRSAVYWSNPVERNHITVYLQQYKLVHIVETLKELSHIDIHIFHPEVTNVYHEGNLHLFPINRDLFAQSFQNCKLILTGAGFETPAEAMYMRKKLICIPIKNHYEQQCNAAALNLLGVHIETTLNRKLVLSIRKLLNSDLQKSQMKFCASPEFLVERLFEKWEAWRSEFPSEEIDFSEMEQPYYNQ